MTTNKSITAPRTKAEVASRGSWEPLARCSTTGRACVVKRPRGAGAATDRVAVGAGDGAALGRRAVQRRRRAVGVAQRRGGAVDLCHEKESIG